MRRQLPGFPLRFLVLVVSLTAEAAQPQFELHPVDTAAQSGAPLRLTCRVGRDESGRWPVIVWHNASSELPVPGGIGPTL
uniref:Ig-like domain-containing protein n=1 Tax=Macrostomum lignano TaxID=282301 RepID=A0A1I8HU37_9PLAT